MSAVAQKIDFKKTLKPLYAPPSKEFILVEVPEMQFIMVDGIGSPSTSPPYIKALGDPRKVAPEKRKTILRQPVRRIES